VLFNVTVNCAPGDMTIVKINIMNGKSDVSLTVRLRNLWWQMYR
jgi:hypothetical protein